MHVPTLLLAGLGVLSARAQSVSTFLLDPSAPLIGPFEKAPVPAEWLVAGSVAIADLDGDGLRDVLVSAISASNATTGGLQYYRNRGDGTFEDRSRSHVQNGPAELPQSVIADIDNDGDRDVIGTRYLLRNQLGVLTRETLPSTTSNRTCVTAGDVDGDGDVDLFFGVGFAGGQSQQDQLLQNLGGGVFQLAPSGSLPVDNDVTQAAHMFDAEGDGDLDLVLGIAEEFSGGGGARLYRNNGTGTFTVATTGFPVPPQEVMSVATADFDLDGDRDIVLGTGPDVFGNERPDLFLRNDGTGQFTVAPQLLPGVLAATRAIVATDLDNDGDADLLLAEGDLVRAQSRVYRNDVTGFTDVTSSWLPADLLRGQDWGVGDLDNDGFVDAVLLDGRLSSLGTGRVRLFLGRGGTTFLPLNLPRCPGEAWSNVAQASDGAFVDIDRDGDLDWFAPAAAIGTFGFLPVLLRNDGQGRFASASSSLPTALNATAVAFVDVDADGDPDVLLATPTGVAQWRNDGAGNLTVAPAGAMPTGITNVTALAVGDVDADGDVDVFAGRGPVSTFDELLRNNGTGVFTQDPTALPTHSVSAVRSAVMVDHDGDGDRDLVLALGLQTSNSLLTVYRNSGGGQFQLASGIIPLLGQVTRVQTFDADGDADHDLLLTTTSGLAILRDQGATFAVAQPAGLQTLLAAARDPSLLDFEGDGDLDIAAEVSGTWRVLRNDGAFVFHAVPGKLLNASVSGRFAAADLDGDGDADCVVNQVTRDFEVVLGRRLQLDAPWLARPGLPWLLQIQFLEQEIGRPDTAIFALGFARLSPPLMVPQLGLLQVDLNGALLVAGAVTQAPELVQPYGFACTWVLPNSPTLIGATLYAQAAVFGSSHRALTNAVFDLVR